MLVLVLNHHLSPADGIDALFDPVTQPIALTHLPYQPPHPPRLVVSVLILQPQSTPHDPPLLPVEEQDLPEVAIGSRLVEASDSREAWEDVLRECAAKNTEADDSSTREERIGPPIGASVGLVL